MFLERFWFYKCVKLREENKQLKEKVEGYKQTRDRLIEMGFPTFMSCREYAEKLEKLEEDLKHKKIAIQNRKTRIKKLEKQLEQAKKLLAKWVELFKPKYDSILPPPIQVDTEKFLKEVER